MSGCGAGGSARPWRGRAGVLAIAVAGASVALSGAVAQPTTTLCHPTQPCPIHGGSFVVAAPDGWSAGTPLKLAVYLHGFRSSGAEVLADKALVAAFTSRGVLVVAPDGAGGRWSVPGTALGSGRDDAGFLAAVVKDVGRRFRVEHGTAAVLGFSLGGSMVWTLACSHPDLFRHHVAIAGGFWRPHPAACAGGAVNLVHIHGLDDATVPMRGRTIRNTYRQGDIEEGQAFWRNTKRCGADAPLSTAAGGLRCSRAASCTGQAAITACKHDGGHWVDPVWIGWALDRIWPRLPQ